MERKSGKKEEEREEGALDKAQNKGGIRGVGLKEAKEMKQEEQVNFNNETIIKNLVEKIIYKYK